jgi:hypothetical protein
VRPAGGHNPAIRQAAAVCWVLPEARLVPAALACLEAPTAALERACVQWLVTPEMTGAFR